MKLVFVKSPVLPPVMKYARIQEDTSERERFIEAITNISVLEKASRNLNNFVLIVLGKEIFAHYIKMRLANIISRLQGFWHDYLTINTRINWQITPHIS